MNRGPAVPHNKKTVQKVMYQDEKSKCGEMEELGDKTNSAMDHQNRNSVQSDLNTMFMLSKENGLLEANHRELDNFLAEFSDIFRNNLTRDEQIFHQWLLGYSKNTNM